MRKYVASSGQETFLSTQHERDAETGFDYRGARFYDAECGRFLSLDPLAMEFAAWSDYNYVLGNPIVYVDPNGRAPEDTGSSEESKSNWTIENLKLATGWYQNNGFRLQRVSGNIKEIKYSNDGFELVSINSSLNDFSNEINSLLKNNKLYGIEKDYNTITVNLAVPYVEFDSPLAYYRNIEIKELKQKTKNLPKELESAFNNFIDGFIVQPENARKRIAPMFRFDGLFDAYNSTLEILDNTDIKVNYNLEFNLIPFRSNCNEGFRECGAKHAPVRNAEIYLTFSGRKQTA